MNRRTIYELAVYPIGSLNTIRKKEPYFAYFSNLKKTVECITHVLAINGWPVKINYTAVYRSLKDRGTFSRDFSVEGSKVFNVTITPQILNPALTTLEIEEMPYKKSRK
jgi:hypothetical protein